MGEHDADLLVVDRVLLGHRSRQQEDAEDVVAVALERRSWLVVVVRMRDERLDRSVLELARRLLAQLLFARVQQVDPLRGHRPRIRRSGG